MLKALFKSQRGFTLIELLAVMAIVATLAGITQSGEEPEEGGHGKGKGGK